MNPVSQFAQQSVAQKQNWGPLLELATQEVFDLMVGTPVIPNRRDEHEPSGSPEMSAVVGLGEDAGAPLDVGYSVSSVPVDSQPPKRSHPHLTAMVGMAGKLSGVLSVRCAMPVAVRIASKMLGLAEDVVNENINDALGEICNMVAGNFKAKIAGLADGCLLSVPTVICGADYELHSTQGGEQVEVRFTFDGEPLGIFLEVHP
ncbi:MAG: chemotaxis protein CheX [Acidobacteria bacterium]|nr:chemotaxis protein CheX [Acidobacteriota bacterium]MBI3662991.1 chemotaxis protein CheX [Acidobacteriota bacterium]